MEKHSIDVYKEYDESKFTKRIIFKNPGSVAFVLNFEAGQELPAHKHPGMQLYLLVLEGSGTLTVDGQEAVIANADVIHCHGDEEFSFKNTGNDRASLYVVLTEVSDDKYTQNH